MIYKSLKMKSLSLSLVMSNEKKLKLFMKEHFIMQLFDLDKKKSILGIT